MKDTLITFLLTKTKLVTYVAGILASLLISWGALKSENKEAAAGAITTLVTLIVSAVRESKKDEGVKVIQQRKGLKVDGWAGPVTQEKVAPSPFKPARGRHGGRPVSIIVALLVPAFLMGCQTPGITVYGDAQKVADGRGGERLVAPKAASINADLVGDLEVSGKFTLKTPRDQDGKILVAETAILDKKTGAILGWEKKPVVAEVKTTPVWVAFFRGGQSWLNSIGTSIVSFLGLGVGAQAVGPAAAAIKP